MESLPESSVLGFRENSDVSGVGGDVLSPDRSGVLGGAASSGRRCVVRPRISPSGNDEGSFQVSFLRSFLGSRSEELSISGCRLSTRGETLHPSG